MEKYDELQKLMKEINNPELQKALEKLRNSFGEMNPDQLRKALEDYEFNEEQYKQRINRTLELFKSLKLNSDLEKLAQSLEELAKQEQEISESEQSPEKDLEQQQAVQKDLGDVQKQTEELDKNAPEKAQENVESLKKDASEQMKALQQELQENIEQLKKQQQSGQSNPKTKQQQRNIQKKMQQMAEQMRSAKQQLNQQQMQVNMAALEYILYSLINLSTNQEELTKETENLPPRSQSFVDKARKERNIASQFSMLSDSLFKVSSEIPSFSNQINKKKAEVEGELSRAVEMLAERDKSNSTFAQRQSLGGINELSSMIASLMDQLQNQQNSGSGGSMSMQQFMEQLKKMSGQQQKLNQEIQNMINDIQGNRLTRDQMDRLNQMSKQQNQIRKQLKELQRRGGLESGDRVLSELERMSEQMEDAINDIRGGQLDRQLMQRQQNILSRMLSAEDAVQERGKEERREATTAEEAQRAVPPDVTLEELQQKFRKMLNDPDRTKYTDDYQRLIEQYFELLKKQGKQIVQ
jgi:DNA repair exonuclease SbcCD ATPase subunit